MSEVSSAGVVQQQTTSLASNPPIAPALHEPDLVEGYTLVKKAMKNFRLFWSRNQNTDEKWIAKIDSPVNLAMCLLHGTSYSAGTIKKSRSQDGVNLLKVRGSAAGSIFQPDVPRLIELASPAPFGKEDKTVFDESVRKGLQICAADLMLNWKSLIPLQEIQELAPRGHVLEPKLYKMHIYQEGGHFEEHVDTQHGSNHLATLIISLPCQFTGGELLILDNHQWKSFPLPSGTKRLSNYATAVVLSWVAFYTDCKHKVTPVTSGTRIVLQFDLLAVPVGGTFEVNWDQDFNAPEVPEVKQARAFINSAHLLQVSNPYFDKYLNPRNFCDDDALKAIGQALESEFDREPGIYAAVLLKHCYSMSGLHPHFLKGPDGPLWHYLAENFQDARLIPLLAFGNDDGDGYELVVAPFDKEHITLYANFQPPLPFTFHTDQETENNEVDANKKLQLIYVFTGSKQTEANELHSQRRAHLGNESQDGEDVYLMSCIVVKGVKPKTEQQ